MAELKTLLKFEDVSLSFGGITALKNVSFDVKENSITSITVSYTHLTLPTTNSV